MYHAPAAADAHGGCQERGEQHVRPAHHHDLAEHDLTPVRGNDLAIDYRVADRHLHPGIVGENPERGEHRSKRHHAAGKEIEARRNPVAAQQHHAEKRRLEHEGGKGLVSQQRPLNRPGPLGQHAPVGAELEGHDDPRDHAHAERHRKDLEPEVEDSAIERIAGEKPHAFDRRQPRRQAHGESREDDVEADDERELDARQKDWVEFHSAPPFLAASRIGSCLRQRRRLVPDASGHGLPAVSSPSTTTLAFTIFVGHAAITTPTATASFCAPFAV